MQYSLPGFEKSSAGPTPGFPVDPFFWVHLAPVAVGIQLQPQRSFRVSKVHIWDMQTERREKKRWSWGRGSVVKHLPKIHQ